MTSLKQQIVSLRADHPELSNTEIANRLGCHPAYVRAAQHRAKGYRPPRISLTEKAEREIDQRDLDILYDLKDGHTQAAVAEHWGVSKTHVCLLEKARKEAN